MHYYSFVINHRFVAKADYISANNNSVEFHDSDYQPRRKNPASLSSNNEARFNAAKLARFCTEYLLFATNLGILLSC